MPIEVNASDTRNKSDNKVKGGIGGKLSNAVKEVATNTALAGADGKAKKVHCSILFVHLLHISIAGKALRAASLHATPRFGPT